MLHLIVTGRSQEPGQLRNASLSFAAHAGLVLAFVVARPTTPVLAPHAPGGFAPIERVRFMIAPAPQPAAESHPSAARARRIVAPSASPKFSPPALALEIPTVDLDTVAGAGDLDLSSKVVDTSDFKPRTLADAIGASLVNRRASAVPVDGIYRADAVDRVVTPLSDNPKPVYPRSMENAGVEADFTVMFVVDSTGRVDAGTVEVPRDVHRLFADAVRYALSRSRYLPAQLAGRSVRQLVAQEFVFRMPR